QTGTDEILQIAQPERRPPEPSELRPQTRRGQRLHAGSGQRHGRSGLRHVARFIAGHDRDWRINVSVNFQVDGPSKSRLIADKTRAEAAIEFRLIRLPKSVA